MTIADMTDFEYENSYHGVFMRVTVHDATDLKNAFNALEDRIKLEKINFKVEET